MTKIHGWKSICAAFLLCVATVACAKAQTFTTLVEFDGNNGATPEGVLVQGANGNLYGTTLGSESGGGIVFEITPTGNLTTLYNFCSQPNCADGSGPRAGLVLATNGNFYGTTEFGGANNESSGCAGADGGCGTIFEITPTGKLTTLYSFCSQPNCTDGSEPLAGLVQGINGNFYGVTSSLGPHDGGTVFEITPEGKFTTLYGFCSQPNCTDGYSPWGGLVQGTNGNFYGTTDEGGANFSGKNIGEGTVFEITPTGKLTTLYSFCSQPSCADGSFPTDGLTLATNGNFYGITDEGGFIGRCTSGCGTFFEVTPTGELTTLYDFCSDGNCSEAFVNPNLVQATNGNFYGTASTGSAGNGAIFEITPAGKLTTLYRFCSQANCLDGHTPNAGLMQATNGTFYGTTLQGGTSNYGTLFSLSVGLGPFVAFVRAAGGVGQTAQILGQGFTGTTGVSFKGTPATTFNVRPDTFLSATVPTGATTGYVTVTTPTGTLKSNVPFQVVP